MITEEYYAEISKHFGNVKRARGNFLYTEKGIRVTDMYLEHGRAILGWGNDNGTSGTSAFLRLKNLINRGLTGSFNTDFQKQLDRAVSDLLGASCKAYIFSSEEDLDKAAFSISKEPVSYFPWMGLVCSGAQVSDFECVKIVPPLPWTENIFILAVRDDITTLFFGERHSGSLCGALARSIYDLMAELSKRDETKWFLFDTYLKDYFVRKGPYLYPKMKEDNYDAFVKHCLNCNIAISPNYNIPSIVPYGSDKGVFTLLKNNPWKNGEK